MTGDPDGDAVRERDSAPGLASQLAPELTEALAGWRDRGRLSNDEVRALRRRRRVAGGVTGGLAALLLVIGMPRAWPGGAPDRTASVETRRGEIRAVRLPDGTTLRLDGATRLAVRYGPASRDIALATGAVLFDVAHDPARPFTVRAGDGTIRVLGTAFAVDRTAGRMDVAVYRGVVRLAGRSDTRGERMPAGWRGHVVRSHAGPAVRFDVRDDRRLWLDVDALRLADLVTILNRRGGPVIQPPPASLANLTITGRFRTDEPGTLLGSLAASYGFVVKDKDNIIILSQD